MLHAAGKDHKPDPVVPRTLPPPTPRTDGAIYQAGQEMALFADLKARRVGDVLTIVLNESTNASKSAPPRPRKRSAVTDTGPAHIRQIHHHQGRTDSGHDALRLAHLRRRGLEFAGQ
jgi:flagellar basal body L-ring protein FlgH